MMIRYALPVVVAMCTPAAAQTVLCATPDGLVVSGAAQLGAACTSRALAPPEDRAERALAPVVRAERTVAPIERDTVVVDAPDIRERAIEVAKRPTAPVTGERGSAALIIEPAPTRPPITPGTMVPFDGAYFDTDKAVLTSDGLAAVAELATALLRVPALSALIVGHTDAQGDATYNEGLSLRRAKAVRDHLIRNGISGDRLSVRGYGERYPVADNDTEAGRATNRRVEVEILG